MSTFSHDSSNKTTSTAIKVDHLSRSLERALDEAAYTGEILLSGRKLREFAPVKCDLSDTITAGELLTMNKQKSRCLSLDLSRNHLSEFPRIFCSFFSLERLNLYHNTIKIIPEQIVQIRMLKVLNLR